MKRKYRIWMLDVQLYDDHWVVNNTYSEDDDAFICTIDDAMDDDEILAAALPNRDGTLKYDVDCPDNDVIYIDYIKDDEVVPCVTLIALD